MSINENPDKIKGTLEKLLLTDRFLVACVIVLVALSSYGLGRLSATPAENPLPTGESVRISMVKGTSTPVINESVSTSSTNERVEYVGESGGVYVGSKLSDRYHLPWCPGAKRILEENKVWFTSREDAEASGYRPAGNCPGI